MNTIIPKARTILNALSSSKPRHYNAIIWSTFTIRIYLTTWQKRTHDSKRGSRDALYEIGERERDAQDVQGDRNGQKHGSINKRQPLGIHHRCCGCTIYTHLKCTLFILYFILFFFHQVLLNCRQYCPLLIVWRLPAESHGGGLRGSLRCNPSPAFIMNLSPPACVPEGSLWIHFYFMYTGRKTLASAAASNCTASYWKPTLLKV